MFYRMREPEYASEAAAMRFNPADFAEQGVRLPGVMCPACGEWWGGRERQDLWVAAGKASVGNWPAVLPLAGWPVFCDKLRAKLGAPASVQFEPGDYLSPPRIMITGSQVSDVMHIFGVLTLIRGRVTQALARAGITGYAAPRLHAVASGRAAKVPDDGIHALLVHGAAWRVGQSEATVTDCSLCGRRWFPDQFDLTVDTSRWDGSDLFTLDRTSSVVMATARVKDLFDRMAFTNIVFMPVPDSPRFG
ncbi:MAG: hypothetical protein KGJ62_14520 [Armatimonadetes bacterium]|nr:hypothetical protein [Armatimonadota bacterium]MDE2207318.1 hypothetical protein [Armatimonadota bacterium]